MTFPGEGLYKRTVEDPCGKMGFYAGNETSDRFLPHA